MPPTVADIARRCGLSRGTVANILSGHAGYAPRTRRRVERLARANGLTPGHLGRSLRQQASPAVALLVGNSLDDPFLAGLLQALSRALQPLRLDTLVRLADWHTADELDAALQTTLAWRPRGVVVLPPPDQPPNLRPTRLKALPRQTTLLTVHQPPWLNCHSVDVDRAAAAKLAVDHLASLGHRRIAMLNFSPDPAHPKYRLATTALHAAGLRFRSDDLIWGRPPAPDRSGEAEAQRMYEWGKRLAKQRGPTALFSWSDTIVAPLLAGFCNAGGKIPGELSVVAVSENRLLARLSVPLTSVGVPVERTAEAVVHLLQNSWKKRLKPHPLPIEHRLLSPELTIRASTSPPS